MRFILKCSLGIWLLVICFFAQAQIKIYTDQDPFLELDRVKNKRIPVKIVNNQIIVPLVFENNLTLNFILDTGVSTTIILDPFVLPLLNVHFIRNISVRGYGREEPLEALICDSLNYRLNDNFFFENKPVIVLKEPLNMSDYLGEPIYGLIGSDLFTDYRVEINYSSKYLRLTRNDKPLKRKKYKTAQLTINNSKPYIPVSILQDDSIQVFNVLIDTGFSGALSLFPKTNTEKLNYQPKIDNYKGRGINGAISSSLKKVDKLTVAEFEFAKVTVNFLDSASLVNFTPDKRTDGGIGGDILKRFKVIFDYNNETIHFKKNKKYTLPFNYNVAGVRLRTDDYNFSSIVIEDIRPESPGEEAGLLEKDELIAVGKRKVKHMKLERIYGLLNDLSSPRKQVTIKRNDEILKVELFLQDIF